MSDLQSTTTRGFHEHKLLPSLSADVFRNYSDVRARMVEFHQSGGYTMMLDMEELAAIASFLQKEFPELFTPEEE